MTSYVIHFTVFLEAVQIKLNINLISQLSEVFLVLK